MSNPHRFYLEPFKTKGKLPVGVALQAFVKSSGDTIGVVYIMEDGGFGFWRHGSCIGTFDTIKALYRKADLVDTPA